MINYLKKGLIISGITALTQSYACFKKHLCSVRHFKAMIPDK